MGSMEQGGVWKSPSAEGPGQAGTSSISIHQYVSDGSLVWSLTLQPPAAAALTVSFSYIWWMTEEITTAKERCWSDGQYCESVNGRGNSNPFQMMQRSSFYAILPFKRYLFPISCVDNLKETLFHTFTAKNVNRTIYKLKPTLNWKQNFLLKDLFGIQNQILNTR